jgi:hypothetical protein
VSYVFISVELEILPKYRWEEVEHNGKVYVVPIEDGFYYSPLPGRTYRKQAPKFWVRGIRKDESGDVVQVPRLSKGRIKKMKRKGNAWGAEAYYHQRAQAVATQNRQKAAAEWKKLQEQSSGV